ncbi:hypothetical protein C4D60_Mb09t20210 [Musa balbisiana]|uniref:O-methyltransferase C-terminal domain-containing protein n=1 Tax=Musa balbisiana TaxID=52838 RepID=A0A4S8IHV0_MUSBA|nr:hypothetical protein C4D60_Mb09t20210 [Musa balbisiana]
MLLPRSRLLLRVKNSNRSDSSYGFGLEGGFPTKTANEKFLFDYMSSDPRFNKVFNEGMRGHSSIIIKNLLSVYSGFDDMEGLVDVGGNDGATLQMIT